MIVRKDLLIESFFNGNPIQIPVLDKDCFNIFFNPDDILNKRVDKIFSLMFLYVEQKDESKGPEIKCKINYNVLGNDIKDNTDRYFLYEEINEPINKYNFQLKFEKLSDYIDEYFKRSYSDKIQAGEDGLELSFLFEFSIKIGCMGNYLIPQGEIIKQLNCDFIISHRKFS